MADSREEEAWKVSAANKQREYSSLLGTRPYDEIEITNLFCLKKKVGFGVYGRPNEYPNLSNYYTGYNNEQIGHIETICKKIIEKNDLNQIRFACTILILHNGDDNIETTVFRIGTQKGDIFIDANARVYKNWTNYMETNKLPECEYCFPLNGNYNTSEVAFGNSPASSMVSKIINCADTAGTAIAVAGAGVFAASTIFTVGPAVLLAAGASATCTEIYSTTRNIHALIDRKKHDQSIGLDDSESRTVWINLASSALCAGATAAVGKAQSIVNSGKSLSKVATCGIHALNATSVAFSGYGFVENLCQCVNKYRKGELTKKDVFDLSCELLFLFNALHSAKATAELVHNMSAVSESVLINKKLTKTQKRNLRRRAAKRRAKGLSPVGPENESNDNEINTRMINRIYPIMSKLAVYFEPRIQIIMYTLEKIGHDIKCFNAGEITLPTLLSCIIPPIIELIVTFKDEIINTITYIKKFFKTLIVEIEAILYQWFENSSNKIKSFFINIVINIKDEIEASISEAYKDINELIDHFENTGDTNAGGSENTANDSFGDYTDNPENSASDTNTGNIEDSESVEDDCLTPETLCLLSKSTELIRNGICNDLEEYSYALEELKRSTVSEFKNKVNNYRQFLEAIRSALTSDNDELNEMNEDVTKYYLIKIIKDLNTDTEFRVKLDTYIKSLEAALSVSENLDVDLFNKVLKITNDATQDKIIKFLGTNKEFRENVKNYIKYLEDSQSALTFDIGTFNRVLGVTGDAIQHFYDETIKSLNTDSFICSQNDNYENEMEASKRSSFPIWNVISEGIFFYYGPHGTKTLSKEEILHIVSQALGCDLDESNSKWIDHSYIILIEVNNGSNVNCDSNVDTDHKVNDDTVMEIVVTREVDEENTASGLIIVLK